MTRQEAEIFLLKDALMQAQHTVSFLHNCLVNPSSVPRDGGYKYAYPEQTLQRLEKWRKLAPTRLGCHHSGGEPECPECQERIKHARLLAEARRIMEAV